MKLNKILFFLVLALIALTSCSKENEVKYSCNETINSWVKSNLVEIHQMDRKEWLQTSAQTSIAIYRAFTPNQRFQFWKDKIKEVKAMNWSQKELLHIQKVEDFLTSHQGFFSQEKLSEEQLNELETFFYKWKKEGEQQFGWNSKVAISIAGSGYRLKNENGDIALPSSTTNAPVVTHSAENCNCNTGMLSDFCFGSGPCESAQCSSGSGGCGWFLMQDCNGTCGGI